MKLHQKLEEWKQRILSDGVIPEFREADVRGTFEVKVATVKETIEVDYLAALLPRAAANASALKPMLRGELEKEFKSALTRDGLSGGAAFLKACIEELRTIRGQVEAEEEALAAQIQRDQKTLVNDLQAHSKGFRKGARFERWLPGNVAQINALTKKKIAKARVPALLELLDDLLVYIESLRTRLGTLAGYITAAVTRLTTQKEQEEQRALHQGVFAEVLGGPEDVAFAFEGLSLNLEAFLPRWLDRIPEGEVTAEAREKAIERICKDVVAAFPQSSHEALAAYSYIDRHPLEVQQKVLTAYKAFAVPFVSLGREPESELQTFIHTNYQGAVPIAERLPEQVPVTETPGMDPNEVTVTRVRIGLRIWEIAGVADWREQAAVLQDKFPLYAVDPSLLDEPPLDEALIFAVEELEVVRPAAEDQGSEDGHSSRGIIAIPGQE